MLTQSLTELTRKVIKFHIATVFKKSLAKKSNFPLEETYNTVNIYNDI